MGKNDTLLDLSGSGIRPPLSMTWVAMLHIIWAFIFDLDPY